MKLVGAVTLSLISDPWNKGPVTLLPHGVCMIVRLKATYESANAVASTPGVDGHDEEDTRKLLMCPIEVATVSRISLSWSGSKEKVLA